MKKVAGPSREQVRAKCLEGFLFFVFFWLELT